MEMNLFGLQMGKPRKNPQQSSGFNFPCLFCSAGLVLHNDNVPSTCGHSSTGQPLFGSPAENLGNPIALPQELRCGSGIFAALKLQGRAEPQFGGKANNGRKGNMISNIV
ncbi:hypothetical protein QQF64_009160 [Cirrhinus molitorella]|uniref:Uncharacterized protein n=1 Tax=Cirrhinus molitorella TaxID=172907 RepID=A0ABR3M0D8_9TELE